MLKKVTLVSLVLSGLVFSGVTQNCFADELSKLEQQKLTIVSLKKTGDGSAAQAALEELIEDYSGRPELLDALDYIVAEADMPAALYYKGREYRWANKYEEAKEIYAQIIKQYPDIIPAVRSRLGIRRLDILALIRSQKYSEALAGVDGLVSEFAAHSDMPQTLYLLGNNFGWYREYDKAARVYEVLVRNYSGTEYATKAQLDIEVTSRLSEILLSIASGSDGTGVLEKLISDYNDYPDIGTALFYVAEQYKWAGQYEQATGLYAQIATMFPESAISESAALCAAQANILDTVLNDPNSSIQSAVAQMTATYREHSGISRVLRDIADRCKWGGRFDEAKAVFAQIAESYPSSPEAEVANAEMPLIAASADISAVMDSGDPETAYGMAEGLISSFPHDELLPHILCQFGDRFFQFAGQLEDSGQADEAKLWYGSAAILFETVTTDLNKPDVDAWAHYSAGNCHYHLGEYGEAVDYYHTLLENWPDYTYNWSAQYLLGECYEQLKRAKTMEASQADTMIEDAYLAVIDDYNDFGLVDSALGKLGALKAETGEWEAAAQYFTALKDYWEQADDDAVAYAVYHLGGVYEQMREPYSALSTYCEFVQKHPDNPQAVIIRERVADMLLQTGEDGCGF